MIAALPAAGAFVPGRSLGGIRLGEPAALVRKQLGTSYGICRGCATTTWYFTYRRFSDEGLAIELTRGRVSAVYTLWEPQTWTGPKGLRFGAPEGAVTKAIGALVPIACSGYTALQRATDVYYIVDGKLWGYGLMRQRASPCR